jgi:hypothetical protein
VRQGELIPRPRYHKDSCRNVWPKHTPLRGNAENCVRCAVARIAAGSLNNLQEKSFAKDRAIKLEILSVGIAVVKNIVRSQAIDHLCRQSEPRA